MEKALPKLLEGAVTAVVVAAANFFIEGRFWALGSWRWLALVLAGALFLSRQFWLERFRRLSKGRMALAILALIAMFRCLPVFFPDKVQEIVDVVEETERPKPKLPPTIQEVAAYANGIVIGVSTPGETHNGASATGFWVDELGYFATCSQSISGFQDTGISAIMVVPASIDGPLISSGSAMKAEAQVRFTEPPLAVSFVPLSPFARTMHMFFRAESGDEVAEQHESWNVAKLIRDIPSIGKTVFVVGIEKGEMPSFTAVEGEVARIGTVDELGASLDYIGVVIFVRDVDYRPTYCGSPVFDADLKVIGMVMGETSYGDTMVLPAQGIIDALRKEGLRN